MHNGLDMGSAYQTPQKVSTKRLAGQGSNTRVGKVIDQQVKGGEMKEKAEVAKVLSSNKKPYHRMIVDAAIGRMIVMRLLFHPIAS